MDKESVATSWMETGKAQSIGRESRPSKGNDTQDADKG